MSTATTNGPGFAQVKDRVAREIDAYAAGEERPLVSYAATTGVYVAAVAALALLVRRSGRPLPSVGVGDIALISVATHKLARLVAKDPITSPLRAPFTRFQGTSGESELAEETRGAGSRKAMGELLTCPFCLGHWVATGLVFGLILAPRATRLLATLFTSVTVADLLQFGYAKVQQETTG